MKKILPLLLFVSSSFNVIAQAQISAATHPFTSNTGIALEDMSSGTTQLVGRGTDYGASGSIKILAF